MTRPQLLKADKAIISERLQKLAEAHMAVQGAKNTYAMRQALNALDHIAIHLVPFLLEAERRAGSEELQRHELKVLEIDA